MDVIEEPIISATINAALKSARAPKQSEPLKILPKVDAPHDDILWTEKGFEQGLLGDEQGQADVGADHILAPGIQNAGLVEVLNREALKYINPEMLFKYIAFLLAVVGFQLPTPPKGLSYEYTQKVGDFIAKLAAGSSLDRILLEVTDAEFLQQLLDGILDILEMEKLTTPAIVDPVLEFLEASPSCSLRGNAELFPPILDMP